MAYGVEVFDSAGKTIFNSNNPCQLVVHEGSATTYRQKGQNFGGGGGGVSQHIIIPDWVLGKDNAVNFPIISNHQFYGFRPGNVSVPSGWTRISTGALPYFNSLGFGNIQNTGAFAPHHGHSNGNATCAFSAFKVDEVLCKYNALIDSNSRVLTSNGFVEHFFWYPVHYNVLRRNSDGFLNYSQAYTVWRMAGGQSSKAAVSTTTQRDVTANATKQVRPEIWLRPRNLGDTGSGEQFGCVFGILGNTGYFNYNEIQGSPGREVLLGRNGYGYGYNTPDSNVFYSAGNDPGIPRAVWTSQNTRYNTGFRIFTSRTNTTNWDYKITVPGPDWGTVNALRAKYTDSNNTTMGLEAYSETGKKHHYFSAGEQWVNYSTLTKPACVTHFNLETPPNVSTSTFVPSLGTVDFLFYSNSSNPKATYPYKYKNYCLVTNCAKIKTCRAAVAGIDGYSGTNSQGSQYAFGFQYMWQANYRLQTQFSRYNYRSASNGSSLHTPLPFSGSPWSNIFGTQGSSTLGIRSHYAVANFGEPVV